MKRKYSSHGAGARCFGFGKYADQPLKCVPSTYLVYAYEEFRKLDPALREAVRRELAERIGATSGPGSSAPGLEPHLASAAAQVVRAGYRKLAQSCHPDAGGADEEMAALNDARDFLNHAVEEAGGPDGCR